MLTLILKQHLTVPLEAEVLTPDRLKILKHGEIGAITVLQGKKRCRLDECFEIIGDGCDTIELRGDLSAVKWIGYGMSQGTLRIVGNVGMHLGSQMSGGAIEVTGHANDWVGAEMLGGSIHIRGNAGDQLGSAYRGGASGMSGGQILVEGSAGNELGLRMKRGLIAIRGLVEDFAGFQMKGGTILLMNGAASRTAAWMQRGTIISLKPIALPPTFSFACDYSPVFLELYKRHLEAQGFDLPTDSLSGNYQRYLGDAAVPGKGEVLVWAPR